jgi:hypothetical protein
MQRFRDKESVGQPNRSKFETASKQHFVVVAEHNLGRSTANVAQQHWPLVFADTM